MTKMRLYLDPADNFLIRDGRPFNQDDAGQARATSRFPPPPDTLYGACRVALARALGWDGTGSWEGNIAKQLGSWHDEQSAPFDIAGPFFEVDGIAVLPIPAHVYCADDTRIIAALPVGQDHALSTDKGKVRYPDVPLDAKSLAGRWGPAQIVKSVLDGREVQAFELTPLCASPYQNTRSAEGLPGLPDVAIAPVEARIGLARHSDSRLAKDGMLYSSARRTLAPGVRMFADVAGVDLNGCKLPNVVPFGGEARFVFLEKRSPATGASSRFSQEQYLVMLTTPAQLPRLTINSSVKGLPGKLVCAALGGVQATARMARSSENAWARGESAMVVPAGTVLFMDEADNAELAPAIGENTHRGYGRYLTGKW
jgi:CRISPR/Cas system CMR-associated protein Cmr3 (group 5 of RAMP superfamily)